MSSRGAPRPRERHIPIRDITTPEELDRVLAAPRALLLKHGINCMISRAARSELDGFAKRHPDVPIEAIEVTAHGALSKAAAERLGVRHESPQLLLVRDGRVAWHAEHFAITVAALEEALADGAGEPERGQPAGA